eukprot:gene2733-12605_t
MGCGGVGRGLPDKSSLEVSGACVAIRAKGNSASSAAHHNKEQQHQKRVVVSERKWQLGMPARGHPSTLMAELLRVLKDEEENKLGTMKNTNEDGEENKLDTMMDTNEDGEENKLDTMMDTNEDGEENKLDTMMDTNSGSRQHSGTETSIASELLPGSNLHAGKGEVHMPDSGVPHVDVEADPGILKFECQMYKVRDDKYLIDVQRLTGDLLLFMDMVGD